MGRNLAEGSRVSDYRDKPRIGVPAADQQQPKTVGAVTDADTAWHASTLTRTTPLKAYLRKQNFRILHSPGSHDPPDLCDVVDLLERVAVEDQEIGLHTRF